MSNTQEPHLAEHPLDENDPITEEWLAARLDDTMFATSVQSIVHRAAI